MRAIIKKTSGPGFEFETSSPEITDLQPGEAKIKMIYSSICGTDVHIYKWDDWANATIKTPQINGHEGIGMVEEVGEGVTNVKPGDFVSYETHNYCEECHVCKQGNIHVCKKMTILGVHLDGTWADQVRIPAKILFKLPEDRKVPLRYCGILEPFGNAHHTLSYTSLEGKNVVISGDGPIGAFAALVAKGRNAKRVFVVGANKFRMNMIKELGFEVLNAREFTSSEELKTKFDELTDGEGIDAIGEFSGAPIALNNMIDVINPGGYLGVLSVYGKNEFEVKINELVFKNIQAQFICGRKIFETWEESFDMINNEIIPLSAIDKIITHEFDLEDYEKGFEAITSGAAGKVLLKINPDLDK